MGTEVEVDWEGLKPKEDPQVYSRPKQTTSKKKAMAKAKETKKNTPKPPAKKISHKRWLRRMNLVAWKTRRIMENQKSRRWNSRPFLMP